MRTPSRIGLHIEVVISVLVGCIVGYSYASHTKGKIVGTYLRFKQSMLYKLGLYK
jgi:hypothetical protein